VVPMVGAAGRGCAGPVLVDVIHHRDRSGANRVTVGEALPLWRYVLRAAAHLSGATSAPVSVELDITG
jgi:hypothetical protein